jgi:cellulose synthase (UDP-forming)
VTDRLALLPAFLAVGFFVGLAPLLPRRWVWARILVALAALLTGVRYLVWRWEETVWPADLASAEGAWYLVVYAVEALSFSSAAIFYVTLTRISDRSAEASRHEDRLRQLPLGRLPSVDVLIPTYNEGLDVLERTIVGALGLDYPNFAVWVLDDGKRDWLRDYCAVRGIRYVRRPNNAHAKAGNLNHGLSVSSSELFAVFDADFVAHRDFLYRTIGFFEDPRVAIVQTPQHFFNRDPFQLNLGVAGSWVDDQRQWYADTMASRDAWECAFCCGSCSVARRDVVMAAGGYPTASVTEDILLTLVLLRRGYLTRYLNERLSLGLAPESLKGYVVQRRRWCRGHVQALFLKSGPLGPGLTLLQRLIFFPFDWLVILPGRLVLLLIPLVYMWTGAAPFLIVKAEELLIYQAPFLVALGCLPRWFTPTTALPFVSAAQGLFASFRIMPTVLASLVRPFGVPFKVTPKGSANAAAGDRAVLKIVGVLSALTVIGLAFNRLELARQGDGPMFVLIAGWALLNLVVLAMVALIANDHSRPRIEERFPVDEAAGLVVHGVHWPCSVIDLSTSGALLAKAPSVEAGTALSLRLPGVGAMTAKVVRVVDARVAVRFDEMAAEVRHRLIRYLFTHGRSNEVEAHKGWRVVGDLLRRALA